MEKNETHDTPAASEAAKESTPRELTEAQKKLLSDAYEAMMQLEREICGPDAAARREAREAKAWS